MDERPDWFGKKQPYISELVAHLDSWDIHMELLNDKSDSLLTAIRKSDRALGRVLCNVGRYSEDERHAAQNLCLLERKIRTANNAQAQVIQ